MVRAILDTNIYISYLLPSTHESTITKIVEAAFAGRYTLLLVQDIIDEFVASIAHKEYLVERISKQDAHEFVAQLREVAEIIPIITEPMPSVTCDQRDDFLLAYALLGKADYLVSGDDDLLVLRDVEGVKVVTPAEFAKVLEKP